MKEPLREKLLAKFVQDELSRALGEDSKALVAEALGEYESTVSRWFSGAQGISRANRRKIAAVVFNDLRMREGKAAFEKAEREFLAAAAFLQRCDKGETFIDSDPPELARSFLIRSKRLSKEGKIEASAFATREANSLSNQIPTGSGEKKPAEFMPSRLLQSVKRSAREKRKTSIFLALVFLVCTIVMGAWISGYTLDKEGNIVYRPPDGERDYNFNILVDTSGSLLDEFPLIQNALTDLLLEISNYEHGSINTSIISFAEVVGNEEDGYTYSDIEVFAADVTNDVRSLINHINSLKAWGATDFETTLTQTTSYISQKNREAPVYKTYTMLISDGQGNAYADLRGNLYPTPYTIDPSTDEDVTDVLDQLTGKDDGSNEIKALQDANTEVFGVMVGEYNNPQAFIVGSIDSTYDFDPLDGHTDLSKYSVLFN